MVLDVNIVMGAECEPARRYDTAVRLESLLMEKVAAALKDLEVEMPEFLGMDLTFREMSEQGRHDWAKATLFDAGFAKDKSASGLFRIRVEAR